MLCNFSGSTCLSPHWPVHYTLLCYHTLPLPVLYLGVFSTRSESLFNHCASFKLASPRDSTSSTITVLQCTVIMLLNSITYSVPQRVEIAQGVWSDGTQRTVLSTNYPPVQEYLLLARTAIADQRPALPALPASRVSERVFALAALSVFFSPKQPVHWLFWNAAQQKKTAEIVSRVVCTFFSRIISMVLVLTLYGTSHIPPAHTIPRRVDGLERISRGACQSTYSVASAYLGRTVVQEAEMRNTPQATRRFSDSSRRGGRGTSKEEGKDTAFAKTCSPKASESRCATSIAIPVHVTGTIIYTPPTRLSSTRFRVHQHRNQS